MNINLKKETIQALDAARKRHPWLEEKDYEDLIFQITLDWLQLEGRESLNDWLKDFF
jgi:hypothetical protein